jgi:phospholipase D1/2
MTFETMRATTTISQIVDSRGDPARACHTEPLWVDRSETDVFSEPTSGNKIESFTTGREYFERLIIECDNASSEIYIAGWQVNWDALLVPKVRLFDLIYRCAARGVKIYVMPWDDTEPVQTYDDQTKVVLESINERVAKAGGRVFVQLSPSYANTNNSYFSHHQKQVVVDRKVAFVGGIDLAYGRMDDARFDLHADSDGREMLNRYNPGIPPLEKYTSKTANIADPDLMVGVLDHVVPQNFVNGSSLANSNSDAQRKNIYAGAWQVRYEKASDLGTAPNSPKIAGNTQEFSTLDPTCQPRMPWQDVHCQIEGPAISPLIANFVLRWNTISKTKLGKAEPAGTFARPGLAKIQVLRSAPSNQSAMENSANGIIRAPKTQQDIHVAMKNLIRKARNFIYIEQQFFVSNFGEIGEVEQDLSPAGQYIADGPDGISNAKLRALRWLCKGDDFSKDRLPANGVLQALLSRLQEVILDDISQPEFHVYITLPVHPEGALSDPTIAVQVFYTMQTLVFGSHSLMNGIKRLIKARELKAKHDLNFMRVVKISKNREFQTIPDEACYRYVTLLNLRNWTKLGNRYVTEQIYVHSKLMIVDDRFALLGSANINDRSLLGERDSELAVLVADEETDRADVNGDGETVVRVFAHQLRQKLWNKLFGFTGKVRAAHALRDAIDRPGCPSSWVEIQRLAAANAVIYEAAFDYIPRNYVIDPVTRRNIPASIIPNWNRDAKNRSNPNIKGFPTSYLPYEIGFWQKIAHSAQAGQLDKIKGFITAFPIYWTLGENLRIKYPTPLIVDSQWGRNKERNPLDPGHSLKLASPHEYPEEGNNVS